MSHTETLIIKRALEFPGLLSSADVEFVTRISRLPSQRRLSAAQLTWLYDIGERKLSMTFQRPVREPVVDLKARAYA